MVLVALGSQTMPVRQSAMESEVFISRIPVELVPTMEATTTTVIEEVLPEPTTTIAPVQTTEAPATTIRVHPTTPTTVRAVITTTTMTRVPLVATTSSGGPPRNTTSLVGCIAYYESTWGDISPNIFQFVPGTWRTYGGTGSAETVPYSEQLTVFWAAWEDDGKHHWAAQKGRCF